MDANAVEKFSELFAKCAASGDSGELCKEAAAQSLVKTALTPGQFLMPAGAATIGGLLGYYNSEKEKDRWRNALYGALTGGVAGTGAQLLAPVATQLLSGNFSPNTSAAQGGGAFNVADKPAAGADAAKPAPAPAATPAAATTPAAVPPPAPAPTADKVDVRAPYKLMPGYKENPITYADVVENAKIRAPFELEEARSSIDRPLTVARLAGAAAAGGAGWAGAGSTFDRFMPGGQSGYAGVLNNPELQKAVKPLGSLFSANRQNGTAAEHGLAPRDEMRFLTPRPRKFTTPAPQFTEQEPQAPKPPDMRDPRIVPPAGRVGKNVKGKLDPTAAVPIRDYLNKLHEYDAAQKAFNAEISAFPQKHQEWVTRRDAFPSSREMQDWLKQRAENIAERAEYRQTLPSKLRAAKNFLRTGNVAFARELLGRSAPNFGGVARRGGLPRLQDENVLHEMLSRANQSRGGKPVTPEDMTKIVEKIEKAKTPGMSNFNGRTGLTSRGLVSATGGVGLGVASNYALQNMHNVMREYMEKNPNADLGKLLWDAIGGTAYDLVGRPMAQSARRAGPPGPDSAGF